MNASEKLYVLRGSKKLTQARLAELSGVPRSTISAIECGRMRLTREIMEKLITGALHVPFDFDFERSTF